VTRMSASIQSLLIPYEELSQDVLPGNAWSLFDKFNSGKRDQLGTLNFLTKEVVREAATEIQTGFRLSLDLPLDLPTYPSFGRKSFEHKVVELAPSACDDIIHINTQSSTQWDGFKHCGHSAKKVYYHGLPHADIISGKAEREGNNGIDNWLESGGIAGRGVLLDWLAWMEHYNKPIPSPNTSYKIPLSDLKAVAEHQNVAFKAGDILIVRSGFSRWIHSVSPEEQLKATGDSSKLELIGVEATMEVVEWLWNHHFAAVAGDAVGFESWPWGAMTLHDHLLVRFGMPIGEMFNLEKLSEYCATQKRWTFFMTSAPLYIPGGVASPPNTIAIF